MEDIPEWTPTKEQLLQTRDLHIELHRQLDQKEITSEIFQEQLETKRNPACSICSPAPKEASQAFCVFYQELLKIKHIQ